jgi:Protein of unknown function DUF262/Protein of unknown function (DUF1524)
MKNQKQTIRRMMSFPNEEDEEGGFWLPNIQRRFVWNEDQICRLFDSILREYPIGTLLVWKTTIDMRRRKFIDNWKETLRIRDFNVPGNNRRKVLVLDGQQRLQSLFIGLKGSYEARELHFNILSGETAAPDDIKFQFKFLASAEAIFPWVRFKDLVFTTKKKRELIDGYEAIAGRDLMPAELDKIEDHLDLVDRAFKMEDTITYQELDGVDNPNLYKEDDVVEIFIRANSGGTRLGKSDLLFSLLGASWDIADEKMDELLESLNRSGFAFDRDFILKSCLVLLNEGARYEVKKFRKAGVRETIQERWDAIAKSIQDVVDFLRSKTFIQGDKALPSYLALIPLVYVRYHFPEGWARSRGQDTYIIRSLLAGAFSGQPDNLLDALIPRLAELKQFDAEEAFAVMRTQGRSLELTEDRFWSMGYGSDTIHLLFNLWYRNFNYDPAYVDNKPQVDHIFPRSKIEAIKIRNPETGRLMMKYREADRNQLANCMLLTRAENGPAGKWDRLPEEWFPKRLSEEPDYLKKHLIPDNPELWTLDHFEEFLQERKKLLRSQFKSVLA